MFKFVKNIDFLKVFEDSIFSLLQIKAIAYKDFYLLCWLLTIIFAVYNGTMFLQTYIPKYLFFSFFSLFLVVGLMFYGKKFGEQQANIPVFFTIKLDRDVAEKIAEIVDLQDTKKLNLFVNMVLKKTEITNEKE
jgi:hypothetical protein